LLLNLSTDIEQKSENIQKLLPIYSGYWRQGWWEAWRLTPRYIQEPLVVRNRDGRHPMTLQWRCTVSMSVAVVYCWEISVRWTGLWNVIFTARRYA